MHDAMILAPIATAHDAIRTMEVRGAARIGRHAAVALGQAADLLVARLTQEPGPADALPLELDQPETMRRVLLANGTHLLQARPTAVTLRNAINRTLDGVHEPDPRAMLKRVAERASRYVERSRSAATAIAALAVERLPDPCVALTHCHSSLAVGCFVAAHGAGKQVRVFADETRPWHQGHLTVRDLRRAGVDATLIVDSAAHHVLESEHVAAVVLGADTVLPDGSVLNKVGTRAVALGAHAMGIPVYVAAETDKWSPYARTEGPPPIEERDPGEVRGTVATHGDLLDVPVRNPVFDRTPAHLITEHWTERGAFRPNEIDARIDDVFGTMEGWI